MDDIEKALRQVIVAITNGHTEGEGPNKVYSQQFGQAFINMLQAALVPELGSEQNPSNLSGIGGILGVLAGVPDVTHIPEEYTIIAKKDEPMKFACKIVNETFITNLLEVGQTWVLGTLFGDMPFEVMSIKDSEAKLESGGTGVNLSWRSGTPSSERGWWYNHMCYNKNAVAKILVIEDDEDADRNTRS